MNSDNRRQVRFATGGPASLKKLPEPEAELPGTMVDVSFAGVLVEVPDRPDFDAGAKVQLRFGNVNTAGEVRHVTERGTGFGVGIRVEHCEVLNPRDARS